MLGSGKSLSAQGGFDLKFNLEFAKEEKSLTKTVSEKPAPKSCSLQQLF